MSANTWTWCSIPNTPAGIFKREATYLPPPSDRRERIATAAMKGLMADPSRGDTTYSCLAKIAVKAADALIEELDKPKEEKT